MANDKNNKKNKSKRKWNVNLNPTDPNNRKTTAYYLLVIVGIVMFLNYFIFPSYLTPATKEVTYSEFLNRSQ